MEMLESCSRHCEIYRRIVVKSSVCIAILVYWIHMSVSTQPYGLVLATIICLINANVGTESY